MRLPTSLAAASIALTAAIAAPAPAATLIIEPVFNRAELNNPAFVYSPLYNPGVINSATGEPLLNANDPGEIITYPAGFPVDQRLVDVARFINNTRYDITAFTLSIVGTALEPAGPPPPVNFTITRDPGVDAIFGDANGDGMIGQSDIFGTIELSPDMKTITFSGGRVPVGSAFTDYNFARTTDGLPFLAAFDTSFHGNPIPEPSTWLLMLTGFAALGLVLRRTNRGGRARPCKA